jgi:VAD1 Analog of StAR-related lipid transfer domain
MSYIKPLGGGIGPKYTECEIHDEMVHSDLVNYVVMVTTMHTLNLPSGGVFSVKTHTCITWDSSASLRLIMTSQVEWTGRSYIKGSKCTRYVLCIISLSILFSSFHSLALCPCL